MTKLTNSGQLWLVRIRNVQPVEIISVLEFVMSKSWTKVPFRLIFVALLALGLQGASASLFANEIGFAPKFDGESRLATFDSAGETHFALSVMPKVQAQSRASDVVVYVDTSASQTAAFQRDSIEALKQLLGNLSIEDRVQVFAVDLDPIPLTRGFVSPASEKANIAVENLTQRVPLGSTDIEAMLESAAGAFSDTNQQRNRNVVYIGDGVSRGSLLNTEAFGKIVNRLADAKISVSSLAIGPQRNFNLMSALANNTGGNLFVDGDEDGSISRCATGLASTVHASVFWPIDGKLDESVVDMFPRRFPPMRTDRDSIVLGTLADRDAVNLEVTGVVDGQETKLNWSFTPEASSEQFAFLPGMISDARADNGFSLPTLGSNGLRAYAIERNAGANRLSDLGNQALANGDLRSAKSLARAAVKLSARPSSTKADLYAMAASFKGPQDDDPFGIGDAPDGGDPFGVAAEPAAPAEPASPADSQDSDPFGGDDFGNDESLGSGSTQDVPSGSGSTQDVPSGSGSTQDVPSDPFGAQPDLDTEPETMEKKMMDIVEPATDFGGSGGITLINPDNVYEDEIDRLLGDASDSSLDVLQTEEKRVRVINERAQQQVVVEQRRAREEAKSNPDLALERIKNMIQFIDSTSGLYPSTRAELRHTLESTLLSFRQKKLAFDERQALADLNISIGHELAAAAQRRERSEEKRVRLVDQLNSLLREGNYDAAVDVADTFYELAPRDPVAIVAQERANFARNFFRMTELRRQKAAAFQDSFYEIERTTIPFPGDQLLVFPPKEEWDRKVARRAKYKNLRLTGSDKEEQILNALDDEANLDYEEEEWSAVEEELEEKYGINIVLTGSAEDDSLSDDTPITVKLTGIRLKNALRIMLADHNATFVVQDEVLKIISLDDAEDAQWFVTNVYNVGDLVAPRAPVPSGFGGGGGGGFGGGGGGFGGGGQGGGGFGGGQFCVQESRVSLSKYTNDQAKAKKPEIRKPKTVNLIDGRPNAAWSVYFQENYADPVDVRQTARKLMKANQPQEVVSMIHGAIQNDQLHGWMYEALVLAMQVSGSPQSEVERALMSAVDLSTDDNDVLHAAQYMAVNGMERRAIKLLKGYSQSNPTRTEPLVVGLRAAQRIKDIEGIKWATIGVFGQEWPDHPEIVRQAQFASRAVKRSLQKSGQLEELEAYETQLQQAAERDCYIKVSWTGDADLDLYVEEPGGTVCSRLVPRTTGGGVALGDKFTPKAGLSGRVSEEYVLPKGFAGDYRLIIKRVWGQVTSGKVTVAIHNHFRSDSEASLTKQVDIDNEGAIVLFALDRGRRTEPLQEHAIQTVVKRQMMVNRNILAQQLSQQYSSSAASDYYGGQYSESGGSPQGGGQIGGGDGGLLANGVGGLNPGAVGFMPVIQNIQEGTFFNVNHATTADRLHVLVSVSPMFNQLTSVSTFNILGDAENAQGIAQGLAGGGGGGGGLGAGGAGAGGAGGGGVF